MQDTNKFYWRTTTITINSTASTVITIINISISDISTIIIIIIIKTINIIIFWFSKKWSKVYTLKRISKKWG